MGPDRAHALHLFNLPSASLIMKPLTLALAACMLVSSGCSTLGADPSFHASHARDAAQPDATPARQLLEDGARLLARGDAPAARALFEQAAALNVTDPTRQTLLGLSYHAQAGGGTEALRLARVGYESALKASPADPWALQLAGRAAFELGDYRGAAEHFARLALNEPQRPEPFAALAVAAYQGGDLPLALLAAERAEALLPHPGPAAEQPVAASALRVLTLAHAAQGETQASHLALNALAQVDPQAARTLAPRSAQLLRTAALDDGDDAEEGDDSEGGDDAPDRAFSTRQTLRSTQAVSVDPDLPPEARQISVDVVILLSQHKRVDRVGVNLLDGLQLQFGARRETQRVSNGDEGSFTRTITRAITLPELTYNINIFNRQGSSYEVAARPMLTAYLGEPSAFFVGKSLRVAVKGINDSSLEKVDVGIALKALPLEIDAQGARLKISAERSFLQDDPVGTFAEGLSTFRQSVSATARVRFGETLVLSGLSESVTDSNGSKTPLLGDLPVVGRAFNQRTTDQRRDAVLILVTPSRPTLFASQPWARSASVAQLIALWGEVIDPATHAGNVTARLGKMRLFSRMQPGDTPLAWPTGTADLRELGAAILNLGGH
jgi:tetratricopeptide (TPR) repeat protein